MADWIMVVITFVYVVATIFICIFNYRSAKATKEQVEISKAQYADDIRLKLMPCLLVERIGPHDRTNGVIKYRFSSCDDEECETISGDFSFKITNVGNGVAKNVQYFMKPGKDGYREYQIISLPANDSRTLKFSFCSRNNIEEELSLYISYFDLIDNEYNQTLSIFLKCLMFR